MFSASEYESGSRPKTASKNIHMIECENPNNTEIDTQVASSADKKKIAVPIRLILRNKSSNTTNKKQWSKLDKRYVYNTGG